MSPIPVRGQSASPELEQSRLSLREQAFNRLHQAIADGTLAPGEALPDSELGEWLGMTRAPIRHALLRLADIGRVDLVAASPAVVTCVSAERIASLTQIRALYVRRVLERDVNALSARQTRSLRAAAEVLLAAAANSDQLALSSSSAALVRLLGDVLENPVISERLVRIELELAGLEVLTPDRLRRLAGELERTNSDASGASLVAAVARLFAV